MSGKEIIIMKENRNGEKWTREETILAFELYCRIPFVKINQSNPQIIELAELLGRTPGSIALKMHNLAHHDPELQKRNVSGMAHGSRLDAEIFAEFSDDLTKLAYQAQIIKAKIKNQNLTDMVDCRDIEKIPEGEYKEQMVKISIGQYFFRMAVSNSYGNRCCITGLGKAGLLVASHIKPWNVSNETEKTNPKNGLCLNALHDKAFDKGLITLNNDYQIIISNRLNDTAMDLKTKEWFFSYNRQQICLPEKFLSDKKFIEYHNDVIFQR